MIRQSVDLGETSPENSFLDNYLNEDTGNIVTLEFANAITESEVTPTEVPFNHDCETSSQPAGTRDLHRLAT